MTSIIAHVFLRVFYIVRIQQKIAPTQPRVLLRALRKFQKRIEGDNNGIAKWEDDLCSIEIKILIAVLF